MLDATEREREDLFFFLLFRVKVFTHLLPLHSLVFFLGSFAKGKDRKKKTDPTAKGEKPAKELAPRWFRRLLIEISSVWIPVEVGCMCGFKKS